MAAVQNYFTKMMLKQFNIDPKLQMNQGRPGSYNNFQAFQDYIRGYPNDILQMYLEFDDQDRNSEDIAMFLNTLSEEATLKNKEINSVIWVESTNQTIADKANKIIKELNLDKQSTSICRQIAKYGRWVVRPVFNDDPDKPEIVSLIDRDISDLTWQFQYDDLYLRKTRTLYDNGRWIGFEMDGENYKPWDFVEFKLGASIFGESFLFGLYTFYRSLNLVERALDLFRVSVSPQLNIYSVPVGNSDPLEMLTIMKAFESYTESQLRKSNNGEGVEKNSSPPSPLLSIYWPKTDKGESGVQVIKNDADINAIADIEYKRKKFLRLLGFALDDDYDPSKNLSQVNIQILRKEEILQEAYMEGVDRILQIAFALINQPITEDSYVIKMSKPSDLDEIARLEKIQLAADVSSNLFEVGKELWDDPETQKKWNKYILEQELGTYYGGMINGFKEFNKNDADKKKIDQYHESIKRRPFNEFHPKKIGTKHKPPISLQENEE
jgi:hypothetical protein